MKDSKKGKSSEKSNPENIKIKGNLRFENKKVFVENPDNDLNKYWRQVQREQLGTSANIYMLFASAILGFLMHFLIERKDELNCSVIVIVSIATGFLIFSLGFYGWFTHNRLRDFRKTARYYKQGKKEEEVSELTRDIGNFTWNLYDIQRVFLFLGFIFSVIGLCIFIYT